MATCKECGCRIAWGTTCPIKARTPGRHGHLARFVADELSTAIATERAACVAALRQSANERDEVPSQKHVAVVLRDEALAIERGEHRDGERGAGGG